MSTRVGRASFQHGDQMASPNLWADVPDVAYDGIQKWTIAR
jgi:hypothetical protein